MRDLIPIVLSLQSKMNEVNNSNIKKKPKFNENFAKHQAEVVVTIMACRGLKLWEV